MSNRLKDSISITLITFSILLILFVNIKNSHTEHVNLNLRNPELSKYLQNKLKLNKEFSKNLMFFQKLPESQEEVIDIVNLIVEKTNEFNLNGLKAVIVFDRSESKIDINSQIYLSLIDNMFSGLINSTLFKPTFIDTIIYLPEANLPGNLSVNPNQYSKSINEFYRIARKHIPDINNSLLLETTTYLRDDIDYKKGRRESLEQYLSGVEKSLINRLYIQGFPFVFKNKVDNNRLLKAENFYEMNLILDSIAYLGFKDIHLNTGILISSFHNDKGSVVYLTKQEVETQINSSIDYYKKLKEKGYGINLNIFIEDKSDQGEGRDWNLINYNKEIFKNYIETLNKNDITYSIFDV